MRRLDLVPDCGSCAALCCIATAFDASEDFAFTKPAGTRCRYLRPDCRCAIHDELVARGCSGCAVYECYGAGQRATALPPAQREQAFLILRVVHELVWLLDEAAKLCPALAAPLAAEVATLEALAASPALLEVELDPHEARARALLRRVGEALGGRR